MVKFKMLSIKNMKRINLNFMEITYKLFAEHPNLFYLMDALRCTNSQSLAATTH